MTLKFCRFAPFLALVTFAFGFTPAASAVDSPTSSSVKSFSATVDGNRLVDANGDGVRILGVNKSGAEYACAQGWGFFDGPVDSATLELISSWGSNSVRVPLNETCWLGINGVSPSYSGVAYRTQIEQFVGRINDSGMLAILDLHWNAPGEKIAYSQQVMADADHAPEFWASVATQFANNPSVAFDLYNEPHDISWDCWRDGCTVSEGWKAAGMQDLVDAVRGTGATNLLIASGLNWGGDLSQWVEHAPKDPLNNLAAGVHIYSFSECNTVSCWDATIGKTAKSYPVVSTEIGEDTCTGKFTSQYMTWADSNGIGYTPWSWSTADCKSGPALLTNYDATPTTFGAAVRDHMREIKSIEESQESSSANPKWISTSQVLPSRIAQSDHNSLQIVQPLVSNKAPRVFVRNPNVPMNPGAGTTMSMWVRLDPRSAGSGYESQFMIKVAGKGWVRGPKVSLAPAKWKKVTFQPSSGEWFNNTGVGVRIVGKDARAGRLIAQIDSFTQSW